MAILPVLPAGASCSYNGVTFDGTMQTKMSGRPVLDEAQRTVKYVEWTLELTAHVTVPAGGGPTDITIADMRQRLTSCGGALAYRNKGFGDLQVNVDGVAVKDVNWGPVPELMSFVPIGNEQGALVQWRVKFHIPECTNAVFQTAIMSCNYETQYTIDQDGYSEIRISGYVEIPMTRIAQGNRAVPDTADRLRERIKPEVPLGFQRTQQTFHLSKNKSRLDFTFTDKEIPAPLPDGTTACDVKHGLESTMKDALYAWRGYINATITMAAGLPRSLAWQKFLVVLWSRLGDRVAFRLPGVNAVKPAGMLFLERVFIEEDVFGRAQQFRADYRLLGVKLADIFGATHFWQPVGGTDFGQWRTSLQDSAFHPRGNAKAQHQAADDVILDLCVQRNPQNPAAGGKQVQLRGAPPNDKPDAAAVDPAKSWVRYRCRIIVDEDDHVAVHKPVEAIGQAVLQAANLFAAGINAAQTGGLRLPTGGPDDVVQHVCRPSYRFWLVGDAVRLGHRNPCPTISQVNGVQCTLASRYFSEEVVGAAGGVPLYQAVWVLEFVVPRGVGVVPVPGNFALALPAATAP